MGGHMILWPCNCLTTSSPVSDLLLKIASLVKPIMKAHSWTVGTLAEFVPGNPGLLGGSWGFASLGGD